MTSRNTVVYLLSIATIFIFALSSFAIKASLWESQSQKDFQGGKPKNVSISSKGEVTLPPTLKKFVETEENYIWCLAEDSKGNIFAGTGNNGRILKITSDGKSELFFDSPEVSIHDIIIDKDDNIYAGTSPDGLVYKISPDGNSTTLLTSKEKYVWALALDEDGNIYAGTGTNGKIFKVAPDGKDSVLFDSEESHIMSLLYRDKSLYAGSEGSAIIYKIGADGKVSVIYDSADKEVHCLAMDKHGNLFASTTSGPAPKAGPQGAPPPPGKEKKQSNIYKIDLLGIVSKVWSVSDRLILSMVVDEHDDIIVGTGDKGQIYSVKPDGEESTRLVKCEEAQALAILKSASGSMFISTGNAGKVYQLTSDRQKEGTLVSKVQDAGLISKWGNIEWEQVTPTDTQITFQTRSGNTSKPDKTWSDWSDAYSEATGQKILSPSARFIRWRVKLTTSNPKVAPVLKAVKVAYLQQNIKPNITSVGITRGAAKPSGQGGPRQQAPVPPKTGDKKLTVKWKVNDPNKDSMEYTVYYKGVNEQNWKLLKEELKTTSYSWDSTSMPDGRYQIKVVADDKFSNPVNLVKTAEKISEPFEIDNTQPIIGDITATKNPNGSFTIAFSAEDNMNHIQKIRFSIDGGDWQIAFPVDEIFDSKKEDFSFSTPADLKDGEHSIIIKITEAAGNVSTKGKVFTK